MKEARVFSIATMKGGSGKSTVSILLAVALAKEKGKRVLIIDCDNQRSIADWYDSDSDHGQPLVDVEDMSATRVRGYLQRRSKEYDYIFIDIPRITDKGKDSASVMLLSFCEGVLIPVIGSQMDVISTIDFLTVVKEIHADQKADGYKFTYHGFINKRNRRKDNEQAEDFLQKEGLPMFASSLSDVKLFTYPSFLQSVLDSSEGRRRFADFYREFCSKFKIK